MHRFANPARFLKVARIATPVVTGIGLALAGLGLLIGLFDSPPDYLQGETVRIMYLHVPSAWLGMSGYALVAGAGAVSLVWRHPLADVAARAAAPVGALFAAVCLVTGSIWGRPTWGTWWVWDARLTSMLLLFLLYLGVIALGQAFDDRERGARAAAILSLVGLINLPVIHYSVVWWNTLHQGSSIGLTSSSVDPAMLRPLLLSVAGFTLLFAGIVLMRMRTLLAGQVIAARSARLASAHA